MHEVHRIKRANLDTQKYDSSLKKCLNYSIYAESRYLDILTHSNWECLVYGDYEVFMPIPVQIKFGVKFVTQPTFCQQLGVFYQKEISTDLFQLFERKLHRYFVRAYHFNESNTTLFAPKGEVRTNHVLPLNKTYDALKTGYNRNRKRKLIELPNIYNLHQSESVDDFVQLFKEEYPNFASEKILAQIDSLMRFAFANGQGHQFRISMEGELVAALFYIKAGDRLLQLGAARKKEIPDIGFFTIIVDHVNAQFSNSNGLLFDFAGSMLPGVALYNESFGAVKHQYTHYTNLKF